MRLLHLTTFLQGGAGRVIADLAVSQHVAGADVEVVTSRTAAPGYGNYQGHLDDLARHGVPVHQVDSLFTRDSALTLQAVTAVGRLYPSGREPQLIHTHAALPSLVGLIVAGSRRRPVPVLQTMHGWGRAKTPAQEASDVAVLNLVGRVAVPSEHAQADLAARGVAADRVIVVPYGVGGPQRDLDDRDRPAIERLRQARCDGTFVVACVGTIGARKNQALLVDALARCAGASRRLGVFVGDGEIASLMARVEAAGLAGRILVHGYSPAARRFAAEADLLVLPSRSEGQPLAVLEAFADGTPVLVSDIPELAELVDDGRTGWRFAADDPAALAAALDRIAALPPADRRAVAARAERLYRTRFTREQMLARYAQVYDDLVRGRGRNAARSATSPAA